MIVETQQQPSDASSSDGRRELTALITACGIYRPSSALLSITGRDRVRWLNGMVSNNIRDLAPGHGVYAFVLNPQGHILGDLYIFNRGESLVAEVERAQVETLLPLLKRYIIMDKVEIEDLSGKTALIEVIGPKSAEVLASGLQPDLEALQFAETDWNGIRTTLVRGDNPCVPNYKLWVRAEQADSAYKLAGAETVHEESLETFRILCGIPKVGQDIRERTLPHETGQERALNFNKGCYIGQEIVERIRSRGAVHKTFIGFELHGPVPAPGTKIQTEGKDVGEITSVLAAPLKGRRFAVGYIRKEVAETGAALMAGEATATPVGLPLLQSVEM